LESNSSGNGLPDYWEAQYGVSDPDGDPDGDGLTNIQEYYLGTDPLNPDTLGNGILDGDEGLIPDDETIIQIRILDIPPSRASSNEGIYKFNYGQTIDQVVIEAKYADGRPLVKPLVFGELVVKGGDESVFLPFTSTISTNFVSDVGYDLLEKNKEAPFLVLNIMAIDPFGNSARYSTRLFILNSDEEKFRIMVSKPQGTYAYGQKAMFEVMTDGLQMDRIQMEVFVEGPGQQFRLFRQGDNFVGEYSINTDDPDPILFYFLVYATGTTREESYDSVRRVEIRVKPLLEIDYLEEESAGNRYAFRVNYPNGDPLFEKSLRCIFNGNETMAFRQQGSVYYADFHSVEGDILVEILDPHGNIGKTKISYESLRVVLDFGSTFSYALLLIASIFSLFFTYRWFMGRRDTEREILISQKQLLKRKRELMTLIKDTKARYYQKKISGEYASRKLADLEGEVRLIDEELHNAGQRRFSKWKF